MGQPSYNDLSQTETSCWKKYKARNCAIAHMASAIIVLMAVLYACGTIVGEWLKTLKVRKKKGGANGLVGATGAPAPPSARLSGRKLDTRRPWSAFTPERSGLEARDKGSARPGSPGLSSRNTVNQKGELPREFPFSSQAGPVRLVGQNSRFCGII